MFTIKCFECNPLQENCYIVSDESGECVIIDCGIFYEEEYDALKHYIIQQQLRPVHLLATHGHLDHNFGNREVFRVYGLKVETCQEDEYLIAHLPEQATKLFGLQIPDEQPEVGRWLAHQDTVGFGHHVLQVLQTPGHTPGSCIFYCKEEQTAFSGDTLFRMSVGRTDLDGGSWQQMLQSMQDVVAQLPKDTVVLPGHGPKTLIADELQYNPYLRL